MNIQTYWYNTVSQLVNENQIHKDIFSPYLEFLNLLKMGAARFSEASVTTHESTKCNISEESVPHQNRCENLKRYITTQSL